IAFFFSTLPRPPRPTLFPYTTLFRSRDLYALLAIALGGFVAATIVQEFARGTRARHRQYGEAYPLALARLLGRNRRRYGGYIVRSEEHTSELQSLRHLVCRLLLEKKK